MEKEFTRYKAQSKEEIDRNEKTMEEMEGKISEVSSKLLVKKMSEAIDGSFFNLTFSSQGSEECRVLEEKARQCTGTAPQNQNMTKVLIVPPPQADLESTIKEKYQLEAQIEHFKDDIASLKETHADEVAS